MVSERSESNHPWHVYIALLADGRFYVGMTHVPPEERARRHQTFWGGKFTKKQALITGDLERLKALSRSQQRR